MAASFKKGAHRGFFHMMLVQRAKELFLFCPPPPRKFRCTPTKVEKDAIKDHLSRWLPPLSLRKFPTFPS
jgi:hypothetical protein